MKTPGYLAVIDVGKTNKKVLIFDDNLHIVDSAYRAFEEKVNGSLHVEDVLAMSQWMKAQLRTFSQTYNIRALSITTHGATLVCMGKTGELVVPAVAYTTEVERSFADGFYGEFGSRDDLQRSTATAEVGMMINAAKVVYYIKRHWPHEFTQVAHILFFPQYLGYLFTGEFGAEPTMLGCHTYMYDFDKHEYSSVVEALGIKTLLPPRIARSWEVLGTVSAQAAAETGLGTDCLVTMGIHDSNSSLLPYLVKGYKDFVLNSTGTWCVAMHPTNAVHFNDDETGKMVFYNMDAFSNPVKTSIFMGGQELETWSALIQQFSGSTGFPPFDFATYQAVLEQQELFILPSVASGAGLFPDSKPRVIENGKTFALDEIKSGARIPAFFSDFATAGAVLRIGLAIQTSVALRMCGFGGDGSIFTEGGFRNNAGYNAVLAALYPQARVACTRLKEATAFGAALLAHAALNGTTPMDAAGLFSIEEQVVERNQFVGLDAYRQRYLSMV